MDVKILVIAPHVDDEILGVGGTMIKNIKMGNEVSVCFITRGYPPHFNATNTETNRSDARKCHASIGVKESIFLDFPAAALETADRFELNGKILDVIKRVQPDEVYIPHIGDMQKDHKIVNEASMVALRPKYFPQVKRIFCYETMSETDWDLPNVHNAFIPNVYVDITDALEEKKKALGMYSLQVSEFPDARSVGAIEALAKYRGAQMHWQAAEAFMLVRELI